MAELLDQVVAADLPLTRATMRELLVKELERRSRAEIDLETALERNAELSDAINEYALLVEHMRTCPTCTRPSCQRYRQLSSSVNGHLERAARAAK